MREATALSVLGNPSWDALFGRVMPQASGLGGGGAAGAGAATRQGCAGPAPACPTWPYLTRVPPTSPCLQAAAHIKTLLGLPADSAACTVHFGHNSHELVCRLLSSFLGRPAVQASGAAGSSEDAPNTPPPPLRVLMSDEEFYSATRQANRLVGARHDCAGQAGRGQAGVLVPLLLACSQVGLRLTLRARCSPACRGRPG